MDRTNARAPERLLHRSPRFWAAVAVVLAFVAFTTFSPTFKEIVHDAVSWVEGYMDEHRFAGAIVFVAFSALSAMLAFASSVVLVPSATMVWGEVPTFMLLWGGWMAGAVATYGIGRLARPLLNRTGYADKLDRYERWVGTSLPFWGMLLFCLALPSELPGYLFGSMRYLVWKFLAAMGIAEGVYAGGVVLVGDKLLADKPLPLLGALAGMLTVAALGGWWLTRLKKRRGHAAAP